jgi:hypothetical protein
VRIIAFAVVAFAVLVAGRSVTAAEPPAAIAAEAKFLPDNCQLLGVVRVEQLLKSPAFQLLSKEAPLVAREQKAIAANLPLPLDQIDRIVLGGGVAGEDEGLFVIRTRATILPETVSWSASRIDPPKKVKVGKYDMYQRRHESYCVVGENLLVIGKESALRAVLARDAAPGLSAHLAAALKDAAADPMATVALALDVESVRNKRRGEPAPFIPGLQLARAEAAADSLALTVKVGDRIEVSAVARAAAADKSEEGLTVEVKAFAAFHQTTLKRDRGAPDEVLDIFKFNVAVEGKRVTASTKCTAAAVVRLLKALSQ